MWMGDGMAYAGLCRQVDHRIKRVRAKLALQRIAVGDIHLLESEPVVMSKLRQASLLEIHVVIVIEVVQCDDLVAISKQPSGNVKANKARRSRYQVP